MPWKVDDSEMRKMHRKHLEMLVNVPAIAQMEVGQAASDEKRDHQYDNYTGDLEESTRAEVVQVSDPVRVDLVMDSTHHGAYGNTNSYASVVVSNGRSTIEEQAEKAETRLNARFKVNG